MAKVHLNEGNLEATYVLYMKYISLFLEKIMTHRLDTNFFWRQDIFKKLKLEFLKNLTEPLAGRTTLILYSLAFGLLLGPL